MIVRKGVLTDSVDIWNWRNDPKTQLNSLNQDPISFENHSKWISETLQNPLVYVYVGIQDKHKIGVCRFNQDPLSLIFEVSINLNSDFRGKGYSRLLLGESINLLFHEKNAMLTLNATIRIDNLESIKLFQNFGFQLKKTFDDYAIYSYVK